MDSGSDRENRAQNNPGKKTRHTRWKRDTKTQSGSIAKAEESDATPDRGAGHLGAGRRAAEHPRTKCAVTACVVTECVVGAVVAERRG